jgi:hypothetical protein
MAKVPGTRSGRRASSNGDEYSEVEARLPRLIKVAFDAYCARASAPEPANTKEFVANQAACRAALAHFMLLVRLSDCLSRRKHATADAADDIDTLILEARSALKKEDLV